VGCCTGSSKIGPLGLRWVSARFASVRGLISANPRGEYDCGPKEEDEGAYEAGDMYFWASGVLFEKALYLGVPGSMFPGLDFE